MPRTTKPKGAPTKAASSPTEVHQLKITLNGSKPSVWRRIQVPSTSTLGQLHAAIQLAFGWTNSHLHEFEIAQQRYTMDLADEFDDFGGIDEDTVTLTAVLPKGTRAKYLYDFGIPGSTPSSSKTSSPPTRKPPTPPVSPARTPAHPKTAVGSSATRRCLKSSRIPIIRNMKPGWNGSAETSTPKPFRSTKPMHAWRSWPSYARDAGQRHASNTRARSRSNLARPYIWRFKYFSRVTCPSVCPLLHGSVNAASTAS